MDPPPGHIAVRVPKAVLLLTDAEYVRGLRRGTWWKRAQAVAKREADAVTPEAPRAPGREPTLLARLRFGAGSERGAGDLRGERTAWGGPHGDRGAVRQEEWSPTSIRRV